MDGETKSLTFLATLALLVFGFMIVKSCDHQRAVLEYRASTAYHECVSACDDRGR